MKINFMKEIERRSFLSHVILNSDESDFAKLIPDNYHDTGELDIEVKVSGIEVDPVKFFDWLEEMHVKLIEEEVKNKLSDKKVDALDELRVELSKTINKFCLDNGVKLDDYYDCY